MVPEWVYYFLTGSNQFGSPMLVAFCVSNLGNIVVIMPLMKIHPGSMPDSYLPLKPCSLGRIVTQNSMLTNKEDARAIWDALCKDSQYQMRPTEFENEYPGKNFNLHPNIPIAVTPNVPQWNYSTNSYNQTTSSTNYALTA